MRRTTQRLLAGIGTMLAAATLGGVSAALAQAAPTPPPTPPPTSQQCDAPKPGDTPDQPGAPDKDNIQGGDQGGPDAPC
ncbi:conserved exported hypothetical protein [uncultured Mycobacterium sp.]|uniref:Uncharacterized protein n=2 Tax=Mycobacteriaceae TaxID=1762 RepID=A0A064CEB5_9MYCO|nr:hypothetical protein [Mycolicibacterium aromaticivorans]KDE97092.1 hypothetical protein Y900_027785 [Mycolicibacterium aromaticivorans JS19b1 = JCM 16368]SBS79583.1 conserved exported hypothetical protein [uncultured Mycobacterium sp.]